MPGARGCAVHSLCFLKQQRRYAYIVRCTSAIKDAAGNITEVRCTYDPATLGGNSPDGRKVKGTIHSVNAATALEAGVRLYDHLFTKPDPDEGPRGRDLPCEPEPEVAGSVERVQTGAVHCRLRRRHHVSV